MSATLSKAEKEHGRLGSRILKALASKPIGMTPGELIMFAGGTRCLASDRDVVIERLVALGSIEETTVPAYRTGHPVKAYRLTPSQIARQEIP